MTTDMLFTQPVVLSLDRLRVPTLLLIGALDNTAIGKDLASPEVANRLGRYPKLAREVAARIPEARLVLFADLGHAPQIQAPERFDTRLIEELGRR